VKVTRPATLTRKVPNTTSQHNSTPALRAAAATDVAHQRDGDQEMPSDDEDGYDQEEDRQPGRRKRHKARTFRNVDLPGLPGSMSKWQGVYLPRWFQYIATVDNIWNLGHPEHLATAQTLWCHLMPNVRHTLALSDKPVFYLVYFLLFYCPMTNLFYS